MMKHKSTDRINPDSIQTLWFTVVLVGFLAIASFMVSFSGLRDVAAWAGIPDWLRWAVPVFIDVAILAYTMAVLIHRSRGEKVWPSWVALGGFTSFSMMANAAHAIALDHPNMWQRGIGASIAALAPLAVFAATEQLGRLVISNPKDTAAAREAAAQVTIPQWTPPTGGEPVPVVPETVAEPVAATFEEVVNQGGFFTPEEKPVEPAVDVQPVSVDEAPANLPQIVAESSVPAVEDVPVAADEPLVAPVAAVEPAVRIEAQPEVSKAPVHAPVEVPVAAGAVEETPDAVVVQAVPAPARPITRAVRQQMPVPVMLTPVWPITRPVVERPRLSLVGDQPRPDFKADSLGAWVASQVADGKTPTGKGAAEFLKVSERTGRTRLNALRESDPMVFEQVQSEKSVSAK